MVNPDSPTFQFFEQVGYLAGKIIRYVVYATVINFIFKGIISPNKKPTQPSGPVPVNPPKPSP